MAAKLDVKILDRPAVNEEEWNRFIAASPQGANYALAWYLDVVWPGWQGIHIFYKGELHAVMPLRISEKYRIQYCFQPALSQFGGVFFRPMTGKTEKVLALKKKITTAVVEAIPTTLKRFVVNFAPEFDYPLPFHWAGYELRTRYSYWLRNSADKEAVFRNFNERTRTYINKARKSGLVVNMTDDISPLLRLSEKFDSYSLDYQLLSRLWEAMRQHGVGRAAEVRDAEGRLHAGLVYQISGRKQLHLFSAKDPACTHLGGMSLAIWHTIREAGEEVEYHDFEGSMLEPVEHFFRGFGTHPVPYLQISKNSFPRPIRWLVESLA